MSKHHRQYPLSTEQMISAVQKRYHRERNQQFTRYDDPTLHPMITKEGTAIPIDDNDAPIRDVVVSDNEPADWGDNTTCLTGNTSEPSYSCEDLRSAGLGPTKLKYTGALRGQALDSDPSATVPMRCARYCWLVLTCTISLMAYLSPLIMVIMPKTLNVLLQHTIPNVTRPWHTSPCQADCQGLLLSFTFREFALLVAVYALFMRANTADMPRLYVGRACVLALVVLLTVAYWLFYGVRVVQQRVYDYAMIVTFAASMVDAMLVIHYLAVVLLILRSLRPEYTIRVVRSPDGESHSYSLGALSLQRAAIVVLNNYYRDFVVYNPYLDRLPVGNARLRMKSSMGGSTTGSSTTGTGFKMYNIDGGTDGIADVNTQAALMIAAARKRESAHNERFYEEIEWERRVRKRRARLLSSTEDAFAHIKRVHDEKAPCVPMTSEEAAKAVFPALARPLQKYLRVTRQQPRHTAEQVVNHLSQCLSYDVSPRTFLDRFFKTHETRDNMPKQAKWSIVCDQLVSRSITDGSSFVLRCHSTGPDAAVQLMCTVSRLPFINLTEQGQLRCASIRSQSGTKSANHYA